MFGREGMALVRKATRADCDAISAIEKEPPIVGDAYSQELLALMIPTTYCAVVDGEVVGFITAHTLTPEVRKRVKRGFKHSMKRPLAGAALKQVLHFVNIKVRTDYQGRGIGKRMVAYAISKHRTHRYVAYETPHDGKHVIASMLSAQEYAMLSKKQGDAYACGAVMHEYCFKKL